MRYIAFSALLLTVALVFTMCKSKKRPDSVLAKALCKIKSVRIFPVISLFFAFFATAILFLGLAASDIVSRRGNERNYREAIVSCLMHIEKFITSRSYSLMDIKGKTNLDRDRKKILVLGDSFVWGWGLTNINQVWWNIMSCELARRGYDCEVYAAAYPGASTKHVLDWLKDTTLLEDTKPELIIIGYVPNDHDDQALIDLQDPSQLSALIKIGQEATKPNRPDVMFPTLYDHIARKFYYKNKNYGFSYGPIDSKERMKIYDSTAIQPLKEFIQRLKVPLIILPTPEAPRPGFDTIYQYTLPLFEKAGFPVYNPLNDFIKKYPNQYYKYFAASPIDQHPGPATSWFLGEYAADVLEQNYASVLGEKRTEKKMNPIEINDWLPLMLEPQAIQESASISQYTFEYPDQSSEADFSENYAHGNFLTLPLRKKYIKLNFKYPVRLSSVKIEGEELLSAEVHTLAINHKLGFDDQKPVSLGKRRGSQCVWAGKSKRDVTSLLISAKTVDGKQAALSVTIEGAVVF